MAQQLGLSPMFGDSNPSENEALEEPEPPRVPVLTYITSTHEHTQLNKHFKYHFGMTK